MPVGAEGESVKRILLLIKALGRGGAEHLLLSAARHLDKSRFEYQTAYLVPSLNTLVGEFEASGVPVHCLDGARGSGWIGRLKALVQEQRIDLVHVHSPYAAIGARIALRRRNGPRLVYTEHSGWPFYHPVTRWGNMVTFPRNDYVFAVSEHVRSSISYPVAFRAMRVPPIETLLHGVDPTARPVTAPPEEVRDELGIPRDVPVVGSVGNFRREKGHRYLIDAAITVRRRIPDVRFVLVGHGPLESELRRRVHERGLDGTVIFAGYRGDVASIMNMFDIFALPSLYEGLAVALIEAMALGRPSVVTRAGGLEEVIHDEVDGLLVPARNPARLAGGMIRLLSDESLRERLGMAARRRVVSLDVRRAVRRMEEVYGEMLA